MNVQAASVAANSVALGTDTTGNYVASIATGSGLDGSSSSEGGAATISLDLNELSTSTTDGDGDFFVVVDSVGNQRKLTKGNISISGFNTTNGIVLATDTTGPYVAAGATAGNGISGSVSSEGGTFTVTSNATNSNLGSTIVYRDASGNFDAGTITAALTGNVTGDVTGNVTGNISGNVTGGTGSFTTLTASDDVNFDSGTLFVDASANQVGIGTASPQTNLDVSGSASSDIGLQIRAGDAGGQDSTQIALSYNGAPYNSSGFAHNIRTQHSGSGQADNKISFYLWDFGTDSTSTLGSKHVMSICGNERVSIGTTSPSHTLDVNGTGRFVNDLTLDEELVHNLGGDGAFPGYSADGTSSYGTTGCVIEDAGVNGSTIYVARRNQWALHLASDTGSQGSPATVVRFADMDEQGSDGAGQVGSITITPSATAYNTSSDYRLKENNVAITDGIDRLKQLSPYRFNFINTPDTTVDGFFAHEVSPVVPESIAGSKDAVDNDGNPVYQGIDQSKLVPLLTAALQEAVAKIEALEARVTTLEG